MTVIDIFCEPDIYFDDRFSQGGFCSFFGAATSRRPEKASGRGSLLNRGVGEGLLACLGDTPLYPYSAGGTRLALGGPNGTGLQRKGNSDLFLPPEAQNTLWETRNTYRATILYKKIIVGFRANFEAYTGIVLQEGIMTRKRHDWRRLFLIGLAILCCSLPSFAQDARYIRELSPPLAVAVVPALVAPKFDAPLPYTIYETVMGEATRSYHHPSYNVSYYFVTYRLGNGQRMSGWTYQENAPLITFMIPWLAETVVQQTYIGKKPTYVGLPGGYSAGLGSRYRVIGSWQDPSNSRSIWYLLQDENTEALHGWAESKNIRPAGSLRQWAEQQRQTQLQEQQHQDGRVAMIFLLFLLYVGFGFWAVQQNAYRGYCLEKLAQHQWGVLGVMPGSSFCFGLFLLIFFLGGARGFGFWMAMVCAAFGAKAAFFLPASLMDWIEYARAFFSGHPAEAQVKRVLERRHAPTADESVGIERVKVNLSDLPGFWESRYRKRRIEELLNMVKGEQRLQDELRAYLRNKAKTGS